MSCKPRQWSKSSSSNYASFHNCLHWMRAELGEDLGIWILLKVMSYLYKYALRF